MHTFIFTNRNEFEMRCKRYRVYCYTSETQNTPILSILTEFITQAFIQSRKTAGMHAICKVTSTKTITWIYYEIMMMYRAWKRNLRDIYARFIKSLYKIVYVWREYFVKFQMEFYIAFYDNVGKDFFQRYIHQVLIVTKMYQYIT